MIKLVSRAYFLESINNHSSPDCLNPPLASDSERIDFEKELRPKSNVFWGYIFQIGMIFLFEHTDLTND